MLGDAFGVKELRKLPGVAFEHYVDIFVGRLFQELVATIPPTRNRLPSYVLPWVTVLRVSITWSIARPLKLNQENSKCRNREEKGREGVKNRCFGIEMPKTPAIPYSLFPVPYPLFPTLQLSIAVSIAVSSFRC